MGKPEQKTNTNDLQIDYSSACNFICRCIGTILIVLIVVLVVGIILSIAGFNIYAMVMIRKHTTDAISFAPLIVLAGGIFNLLSIFTTLCAAGSYPENIELIKKKYPWFQSLGCCDFAIHVVLYVILTISSQVFPSDEPTVIDKSRLRAVIVATVVLSLIATVIRFLIIVLIKHVKPTSLDV